MEQDAAYFAELEEAYRELMSRSPDMTDELGWKIARKRVEDQRLYAELKIRAVKEGKTFLSLRREALAERRELKKLRENN